VHTQGWLVQGAHPTCPLLRVSVCLPVKVCKGEASVRAGLGCTWLKSPVW